MKNCLFCQRHKIKPDLLLESENLFVKVGVAILAPGHVMIIPKKHMSCFAELPFHLSKEFTSVKDKVYHTIKQNFSEPILYEHGVYGQSICHAHIHVIPSKSKYYNLENIKENIFKSLRSTRIYRMPQITEVLRNEGSYFYLEQNGKKWVIHTKGQPEGKFTFRKEFVRLTGLYGLETWHSMPESEKQRNIGWVKATKEVFGKRAKK